ncbi:YbjQ family protein [Arcobacter sp. LA11]|uniref:YbjQ family protein n=1 Tax=Arcobacter sp. LA11 TaxID=1898176 RepID=UPI0009325B3B|nr:heavy metal-binding domain-containing protein [Arcobacter sp. LA11]
MYYDLVIIVVLIILGFIFGSIAERRHFTSIKKREEEYLFLPIHTFKRATIENINEVKLVSGNVVVSIDYFKQFFAALVNFFGGNIQTYETLLDRARREAILRMKEQALDSKEIANVKVETSSISKNAKGGVGSVEVIAYGTAIY